MKQEREDSSSPILVIHPETWREAVSLAQRMPQFVFRGQANQHWGLSTKMERVCKQNRFPTNFLKNREDAILRDFQRRAYHYIQHPPSTIDKLEWLALIQHYGGPTRLLDFTKSFYVAAFFALESAENDAAVWALNGEWLYQHTDNTIHEGETIYDLHEKSRRTVEENLSGNHETMLVMGAEPERLNERIAVQQGLFVIPGNVNYSFAQNLAVTLGGEESDLETMTETIPFSAQDVGQVDYFEHGLAKIILPVELHNTALLDLDTMNINASTLFPGLEGFARSLNRYLRDVM